MTSPPENLPAATAGEDTNEDFSDEFKCCVCLDLIYKPVVLACGHISCFWCVFEAMDQWQESRCPVCRHAYYHFPSICWMLHFILLKLYPKAYQIRETQVKNMEMARATFSPEYENSLNHVSSENNITKENPANLSDKITKNVDSEGKCSAGNDDIDRCYKQISITDILCLVCKELLCRPIVLNCGHVFCEACISVSNNEPCQCPMCQSMHPNGFPKVCLVLEGFLKQHVSEKYAARIDKLQTCELGNSSTDLTLVPQGAKCSSVPMLEHLCNSGHKIHFGVGCDCCGVCPLMGNRYKCKDCVEEIGFDLCENCYNSSSNLHGRFNQQHKPDHKFEVLEPSPIIFLSAEDYESGSPENQTDDSTAPDFSLDAQQDPEGDVTSPIHTNDTFDGNEGLGPTS